MFHSTPQNWSVQIAPYLISGFCDIQKGKESFDSNGSSCPWIYILLAAILDTILRISNMHISRVSGRE